MKAISLWQPWASFAIYGLKRHEARSWPCPPALIGQPLAIHAAKTSGSGLTMTDDARDERYMAALSELLELYWADRDAALPSGAVLGIARVTHVLRTNEAMREGIVRETDREWILGDFSADRFAWRLEVFERFAEPIPAKGAQGIWNWEDPRSAS